MHAGTVAEHIAFMLGSLIDDLDVSDVDTTATTELQEAWNKLWEAIPELQDVWT